MSNIQFLYENATITVDLKGPDYASEAEQILSEFQRAKAKSEAKALGVESDLELYLSRYMPGFFTTGKDGTDQKGSWGVNGFLLGFQENPKGYISRGGKQGIYTIQLIAYGSFLLSKQYLNFESLADQYQQILGINFTEQMFTTWPTGVGMPMGEITEETWAAANPVWLDRVVTAWVGFVPRTDKYSYYQAYLNIPREYWKDGLAKGDDGERFWEVATQRNLNTFKRVVYALDGYLITPSPVYYAMKNELEDQSILDSLTYPVQDNFQNRFEYVKSSVPLAQGNLNSSSQGVVSSATTVANDDIPFTTGFEPNEYTPALPNTQGVIDKLNTLISSDPELGSAPEPLVKAMLTPTQVEAIAGEYDTSQASLKYTIVVHRIAEALKNPMNMGEFDLTPYEAYL